MARWRLTIAADAGRKVGCMITRMIGRHLGAWAVFMAVVIYLALSHWLTTHAADQPWAIAALLGPVWCLGLAAVLRGFHRGRADARQGRLLAALVLAAAVVAVIVANGGIGDVHRLYVTEYVVIHLALCFSFGITLFHRDGRPSLIEGVAERVHGSLTPAMAAYARKVTRAWVIYFLVMALVSAAVYALGSWSAWALLANVITPLAIVALFVGEHALRYRMHPEFERATLMDAVRAYRRPPVRKVA